MKPLPAILAALCLAMPVRADAPIKLRVEGDCGTLQGSGSASVYNRETGQYLGTFRIDCGQRA